MYGYFPRYFWQVSIYVLMTEPLFTAIYNRYLATTLADKITALYNTEADEEAVYPYGTFSLVSDVPDWTFDENFENCIIQFKLFSKADTCSEIIAAVVALKAAFDFFDLVVAGYSTISLTRMTGNLVRVEKVWQYNVSYRIEIQND
ncbi:hypothetical protein LCGC14_1310730 [marine sediment metagenome]|uniref:DUF3168 domain-containing protein n=1 Tax=marine sediment metagenome TaxID=412755 RepID=A0A0F9KMZ9_9ZZZZ